MVGLATKLAAPLASKLALGLSAGIGAAPFDPASLFDNSEVGGWYDPSDLSTLWQDTAATTPSTVGSRVRRIDDKSGNGLNLTAASDAASPTLRQDASGFYYLERDGSDDYMESAASLTLEATWTMVYAGQFPAGASTSSSAMAAISLNTTNYMLVGFRQDVARTRTVVRADSTSDATQTTAGPSGASPAGTNHMVFGYLDATTVATATGASAYDTAALSAAPFGPVASCRLRLGTQAGAALTIATRCYGLIAVKRALTMAEKSGLVSYFNGKMGL